MEPGKTYIQTGKSGDIEFTFKAESKLKNGNIKGKVNRSYEHPNKWTTITIRPEEFRMWKEVAKRVSAAKKDREVQFSGYNIEQPDGNVKIKRRHIDLDTTGDYGADPLGDGTFRMVPSGDVVDFDERNRRLNKKVGSMIKKSHVDAVVSALVGANKIDLAKKVKKAFVEKRAATGDGQFEKVDTNNYQHLEVGNIYLWKARSDKGKSKFLGWFDESGNKTDSEDVDAVHLKFEDVDDGFTWDAYHHGGAFVVGSGADPMFVKESN